MKLAFCGDDCSACPRYIATINGSIKDFQEVANLMERVGWNQDKLKNPEKLKCTGCQDIEDCEYGVKKCCIDKNIENCGQCIDYPCAQIEKAFEITNGYVEKFKEILSKEEYDQFLKAFFSKKENLDKENNKINRKS